MIVAFAWGFGQAGWWLLLAWVATCLLAFSLAAIYRPSISKGRRTTSVVLGKHIQAQLLDEGPETGPNRKANP